MAWKNKTAWLCCKGRPSGVKVADKEGGLGAEIQAGNELRANCNFKFLLNLASNLSCKLSVRFEIAFSELFPMTLRLP
jgi:hypothetical protein